MKTIDPIEHTLPSGAVITITVTMHNCAPGSACAFIGYAGGLDLSQWSSREAYPIAAIEKAVASAMKATAAVFSHCDDYGVDGDSTWEEWYFTLDTMVGSTEVDPGSMGEGWDNDQEAAEVLVEVLQEVFSRRGWIVDVSLGHGGSRDVQGDRDSDAARAIDAVTEKVFEVYCAENGDPVTTLAALEEQDEVPPTH